MECIRIQTYWQWPSKMESCLVLWKCASRVNQIKMERRSKMRHLQSTITITIAIIIIIDSGGSNKINATTEMRCGVAELRVPVAWCQFQFSGARPLDSYTHSRGTCYMQHIWVSFCRLPSIRVTGGSETDAKCVTDSSEQHLNAPPHRHTAIIVCKMTDCARKFSIKSIRSHRV